MSLSATSTEMTSKLRSHLNIAETILSQNSGMIFRTTAKSIGEKASQITPERPVLHGFNGKFSAVSSFFILIY